MALGNYFKNSVFRTKRFSHQTFFAPNVFRRRPDLSVISGCWPGANSEQNLEFSLIRIEHNKLQSQRWYRKIVMEINIRC